MDLKSEIPFLILLILFVPIAHSHTPLLPYEENDSIETAFEISNPTKSWAIYSELHEGKEAHYYAVNMEQGQRLRISLFKPTSERNFLPNLVLIGPELDSNDELPDYIEKPDGTEAMLFVADNSSEAVYEPFTPSSSYFLADVDMEIIQGGTYYIVIYEPSTGGRYGLAVGYL